jgi:hypothetical protein
VSASRVGKGSWAGSPPGEPDKRVGTGRPCRPLPVAPLHRKSP